MQFVYGSFFFPGFFSLMLKSLVEQPTLLMRIWILLPLILTPVPSPLSKER